MKVLKAQLYQPIPIGTAVAGFLDERVKLEWREGLLHVTAPGQPTRSVPSSNIKYMEFEAAPAKKGAKEQA